MRVGNKIRYYRNNELLREIEETNTANMIADFTFYQAGARIYNPKIVDVEYQHGSQYFANVTSYSGYYPFGMLMPGRSGGQNDYRYNFQGQESDDEVKGKGNSVNYKYRMHDPRLGRFFATDPLEAGYPHNSPYAFSENVLINAVELEGLEPSYVYAPNSQTIMRPKLENFLSQEELKFNAKIDKFLATDPTALQLAAEQKKRESEAAYQEFLKKQGTIGPTDYGKKVEMIRQNGHNMLDVAGMIPVAGEIADGLNAAWYAAEGDYVNSGLSAAGMVPFFGWAATGTKWTLKAASYVGEVAYKGAGELFEASFKLADGRTVGIMAETAVNGKKISLEDIAFYGNKADGSAFEAGDLGKRELLELRQAVNAWAKEQGFETIEYLGKRAENSSSKNPGMDLNWTIDLTKK